MCRTEVWQLHVILYKRTIIIIKRNEKLIIIKKATKEVNKNKAKNQPEEMLNVNEGETVRMVKLAQLTSSSFLKLYLGQRERQRIV